MLDAAALAGYEELLGCPIWSVALFVGLAAVYIALQLLQQLTASSGGGAGSAGKAKAGGGAVGTEADFRAFQWRWGIVYTTIILADWLQGTHMYALYSSYDLSKDQIGNLFLTGFGSGAVFSTVIGPFVDRFGRKRGCILYCVLEVRAQRAARRAHAHRRDAQPPRAASARALAFADCDQCARALPVDAAAAPGQSARRHLDLAPLLGLRGLALRRAPETALP
jgi:hypothetical protein